MLNELADLAREYSSHVKKIELKRDDLAADWNTFRDFCRSQKAPADDLQRIRRGLELRVQDLDSSLQQLRTSQRVLDMEFELRENEAIFREAEKVGLVASAPWVRSLLQRVYLLRLQNDLLQRERDNAVVHCNRLQALLSYIPVTGSMAVTSRRASPSQRHRRSSPSTTTAPDHRAPRIHQHVSSSTTIASPATLPDKKDISSGARSPSPSPIVSRRVETPQRRSVSGPSLPSDTGLGDLSIAAKKEGLTQTAAVLAEPPHDLDVVKPPSFAMEDTSVSFRPPASTAAPLPKVVKSRGIPGAPLPEGTAAGKRGISQTPKGRFAVGGSPPSKGPTPPAAAANHRPAKFVDPFHGSSGVQARRQSSVTELSEPPLSRKGVDTLTRRKSKPNSKGLEVGSVGPPSEALPEPASLPDIQAPISKSVPTIKPSGISRSPEQLAKFLPHSPSVHL